MIDAVLVGVGGQSIRLASKMLSVMSASRGWNACSYDLNPQVRPGESWTMFIRIPDSGENPLPPFISDGGASVILAFDPYEAARNIRYLSQSGAVISATTPVQPVPSPNGPRRYDVGAVLQEVRLALYNGMAQKVAAKQGTPSNQARLIPVNDVAIAQAIGVPSSANVLVSVLLAEAVKAGCLPFTLKELCGAISACVKPEFAEINLQAVRAVMSV